MSEIDDSKFILDLRQRVLANKAAGLPAKTGISDEEQARVLCLLRPARAAAATPSGKKSSGRKGPVKPMSDADVDSLFS